MSVPPMVSTSWLKQQLEARSPDLVVLDASWDASAPHESYRLYTEKHIPGTLFFDQDKFVKPRPMCARNLPDVTEFTEYTRSLGICSASHVVVYDRGTTILSIKAWWIFRVFGHCKVSVLNGGLKRWDADGYNVTQGHVSSDKIGDFEVRVNRSMIVEFDEMMDIVTSRRAQIVDTRAAEHFAGLEPEPCTRVRLGLQSMDMPVPSSMHAGHMPGARNIFKLRVLDEKTNCFLTREELIKLFEEAGIDLTKPLVTTCYMGHSASVINMAALLCGYEHMALYYGSWTEYGQLAPAELVECG